MARTPTRRRRSRINARLDLGALEIAGALLTPDIVVQIAAFDASEQSEEGYGVPPGLKVRDEIARYFRIGEALWSRFEVARGASIAASEQFVLDLLRQCFGFETIAEQPPVRMGERVFPPPKANLPQSPARRCRREWRFSGRPCLPKAVPNALKNGT